MVLLYPSQQRILLRDSIIIIEHVKRAKQTMYFSDLKLGDVFYGFSKKCFY